ncbi:alpha/beta hydrolase family protein [Undibacterium sp.]|uniref:alpha/beta hydrolase family protein n=1 Tax=Undibacterium sp. TaxID=1914977 RepID=UPI00374D95A1
MRLLRHLIASLSGLVIALNLPANAAEPPAADVAAATSEKVATEKIAAEKISTEKTATAEPPEKAASAEAPALATGPLTLTEALDPDGIMSARLSPDGKHIAVILFNGLGYSVVLIDSETMVAKTIITSRYVSEGMWSFNKQPRSAIWATNDLLAVDYGIEAESVNLKGDKVASIGDYVIRKADSAQPDSPMLIVYTDAKSHDLALANARTGELTRLDFPMSGKPIGWAFDKSGTLRALTLINSAFWKDAYTVTNWYRADAAANWEKLEESSTVDDYWSPMYVPEQDHTLVISARAGRDTYAVFNYDTKKRQIGEMMAGHPTQDILDVKGLDAPVFESVQTGGMVPQQVWFEPVWNRLQRSVDNALPHHVNRLSGDPAKRVLIFSYSDVDPGAWYVMDVAAMKMTRFGRAKPSIDPARMRPMEILSYKAKDGLSIPAFLTKPADTTGPAPMVVMIHGGPTERDYWEWDENAQLLAAHGYVVFQPQFRGSSGFGRKFEEAGFGQWGLAMQDDVTAGVEYLIAKGIADPKRICIYGASYGGYAALWGLVKTPNLYQCGISFAGVSDLEYMFEDSSDRNSNKISRVVMRARIGDLKLNKEAFDRVSPLKQADRIKVPVLLMHGEDDERVPISHGKKMKRALEDQHKTVEWLTFEKEGHGLHYLRNEASFFTTLFAFLDKYIGPAGAKPQPVATATTAATALDK